MLPAIDVAIVAYNRFDLTQSCLGHLSQQTAHHNVIVCDNGSTDDTAERIAREWPHVRLLSLSTNSPFAVACNRAVQAGSAEYVVLLNNDVDCRPDFLGHLVAPLASDPATGSVAGLMLRPGERTIDSIGLTVDPTLAGFPRLQGEPVERAGDSQPVLAGPAGTGAAYRRSAWEEVGGLDEALFAYSEDLDLALRLRIAGRTRRSPRLGYPRPSNSVAAASRGIWPRIRSAPIWAAPAADRGPGPDHRGGGGSG